MLRIYEPTPRVAEERKRGCLSCSSTGKRLECSE